jgi:hypothetical protein
VIIGLLGQAAVVCPDQIVRVPESWQLLVDQVSETGNSAIIQLILYATENNASFVYQSCFVSHLLSPLLAITKSQADVAKQQSAVRLMTELLLMWPGVLWFGLRAGVFRDIVRLLSRFPGVILSMFKRVLNLTTDARLLDGYVGFARSALLPLGLIPTLSRVADRDEDTAAFLPAILPFVPAHSDYALVPRAVARDSCVPLEPPVRVYKLSYATRFESANSLSQFTLPPDVEAWNWPTVRRLLSIVLPNDPSEAVGLIR